MSPLVWAFFVLLLVAAVAVYAWTRPPSRTAQKNRSSRGKGAPPRVWTDDELREQLGVSAARARTTVEAQPVAEEEAGPVVEKEKDPVVSALPDGLRRSPLPGPAARLPERRGDQSGRPRAAPQPVAPSTPDPSPTPEPPSPVDAARTQGTPPSTEVEPPPAAPEVPSPSAWESDPADAAASRAGAPEGGAFVRAESPLWPDGAAAVRHLVGSLAAAVGGGVSVLRYDAEADVYHVDALAGVPLSGTPDPLPAEANPLHYAPQDRVLSLLREAEKDALTYREAPGETVGQAVVRALAEPPSPRVLVVVDRPPDAAPVGVALLDLVGRYVDLLADLTDRAPADDSQLALDASSDEAGGPDEDVPLPTRSRATAPPSLPKGVILAGEIAAAREAGRALAFALVTRADAEAILRADYLLGTEETASAVADAEADLRQRIAAGPLARRVEVFGPLLLGVFLDADAAAVRTWASGLAASGPQVHVGAVAPAAGDAGAIREAAKHALQAAYDRAAVCVVA